MTDNDLRHSRHWRCSQCGSSWPLDMAVCGNPACGADLGIYGQVIEPEPERAPEPEKQPEDAKKVPRPEEEKPRGDEKREKQREKPDRAAQKREAREERQRQKAAEKASRRAASEERFTGGELLRVPNKYMLPLLIAIPVLVWLVFWLLGSYYVTSTRWMVIELIFVVVFVVTLIWVSVAVLRREEPGSLKVVLLPPLITGAAVAAFAWFGFEDWDVVLGAFSIYTSATLVLSAASKRWRRERRYGSPAKCVVMAVLTFVLTLFMMLAVLLMAEDFYGNIIPHILAYIFPSALGAACAYVIYFVTRRDRAAPVLLLYTMLAMHLYLWGAYSHYLANLGL